MPYEYIPEMSERTDEHSVLDKLAAMLEDIPTNVSIDNIKYFDEEEQRLILDAVEEMCPIIEQSNGSHASSFYRIIYLSELFGYEDMDDEMQEAACRIALGVYRKEHPENDPKRGNRTMTEDEALKYAYNAGKEAYEGRNPMNTATGKPYSDFLFVNGDIVEVDVDGGLFAETLDEMGVVEAATGKPVDWSDGAWVETDGLVYPIVQSDAATDDAFVDERGEKCSIAIIYGQRAWQVAEYAESIADEDYSNAVYAMYCAVVNRAVQSKHAPNIYARELSVLLARNNMLIAGGIPDDNMILMGSTSGMGGVNPFAKITGSMMGSGNAGTNATQPSPVPSMPVSPVRDTKLTVELMFSDGHETSAVLERHENGTMDQNDITIDVHDKTLNEPLGSDWSTYAFDPNWDYYENLCESMCESGIDLSLEDQLGDGYFSELNDFSADTAMQIQNGLDKGNVNLANVDNSVFELKLASVSYSYEEDGTITSTGQMTFDDAEELKESGDEDIQTDAGDCECDGDCGCGGGYGYGHSDESHDSDTNDNGNDAPDGSDGTSSQNKRLSVIGCINSAHNYTTTLVDGTLTFSVFTFGIGKEIVLHACDATTLVDDGMNEIPFSESSFEWSNIEGIEEAVPAFAEDEAEFYDEAEQAYCHALAEMFGFENLPPHEIRSITGYENMESVKKNEELDAVCQMVEGMMGIKLTDEQKEKLKNRETFDVRTPFGIAQVDSAKLLDEIEKRKNEDGENNGGDTDDMLIIGNKNETDTAPIEGDVEVYGHIQCFDDDFMGDTWILCVTEKSFFDQNGHVDDWSKTSNYKIGDLLPSYCEEMVESMYFVYDIDTDMPVADVHAMISADCEPNLTIIWNDSKFNALVHRDDMD